MLVRIQVWLYVWRRKKCWWAFDFTTGFISLKNETKKGLQSYLNHWERDGKTQWKSDAAIFETSLATRHSLNFNPSASSVIIKRALRIIIFFLFSSQEYAWTWWSDSMDDQYPPKPAKPRGCRDELVHKINLSCEMFVVMSITWLCTPLNILQIPTSCHNHGRDQGSIGDICRLWQDLLVRPYQCTNNPILRRYMLKDSTFMFFLFVLINSI